MVSMAPAGVEQSCCIVLTEFRRPLTSVALGPVDITTSKLKTSVESLQQAFLF